MRKLAYACLALVLALGATGCQPTERPTDDLQAKVNNVETRLNALWAWADTMAVDGNPVTTPLVDDPAYSYLQSRAICATVQYVEQLHRVTDPNARPEDVKALCGPPTSDPVYPPLFPPPED